MNKDCSSPKRRNSKFDQLKIQVQLQVVKPMDIFLFSLSKSCCLKWAGLIKPLKKYLMNLSRFSVKICNEIKSILDSAPEPTEN